MRGGRHGFLTLRGRGLLVLVAPWSLFSEGFQDYSMVHLGVLGVVMAWRIPDSSCLQALLAPYWTFVGLRQQELIELRERVEDRTPALGLPCELLKVPFFYNELNYLNCRDFHYLN